MQIHANFTQISRKELDGNRMKTCKLLANYLQKDVGAGVHCPL
jgi:hypothetical protein